MLNKILTFILPFALIFFAFSFGPAVGILVSICIVGYIVYSKYCDILLFFGNLKYQKDVNGAFALFERAYKTGRLSPKSRLYYAYMALREGRLEKAERLINSVVAYKQPKDIKVLAKSYQGLLYWKKGNLDEAIAEYEELYSHTKNTTIYGNLGFLYILEGDLEKAEEFNLEAYDFNPESIVILDNIGQVYCALGDYQNALSYQEELMEQQPQFPTPYVTYAEILYGLGDKAGALANFKKALEYNFSALAAVTREQVEKRIREVTSEIE